jgi:hypothetical protein
LSALRGCLFNIFSATFLAGVHFLHPQPEEAGVRNPFKINLGEIRMGVALTGLVWLRIERSGELL